MYADNILQTIRTVANDSVARAGYDSTQVMTV
jgi:hypothetical protein